MVFQSYALYPAHDGAREPGLRAEAAEACRKAEIDRAVRDAARHCSASSDCSTASRASSPAASASASRWAARIVRQPQVFLFDEPLSNLDAKLRRPDAARDRALHQQLGATMIYVTHDQVEAMTLGDRIVVLTRGSVQQIDTPLELYERPANMFVAGFIGSPAMNLIEGEIVSSPVPVFGRRRAGSPSLSVRAIGPRRSGAGPGHPGHPARGCPSRTRAGRARPIPWPGRAGGAAWRRGAGPRECGRRPADRSTPTPVPAAGSEIDLEFPADRTHLFAEGTGQRL